MNNPAANWWDIKIQTIAILRQQQPSFIDSAFQRTIYFFGYDKIATSNIYFLLHIQKDKRWKLF